jgi:DNA-binding NarL/FixJ family response regulator
VTERFDAVIVDYELPDKTGAQLAQEIRAVEASVRIIVFSGRVHLPPGELAYLDVHIVKGSHLDNIDETIRGLLDLPAGLGLDQHITT